MFGPEDERAVAEAKKKNPDKSDYYFDYDRNGDMPNPFSTLSDNDDQIAHHVDADASGDTINFGSPLPGAASDDIITFGGNDHIDLGSIYSYHYPPTDSITFDSVKKPEPDLKSGSNQKYQEDKGIDDLKAYVSSTYQGHYTNKNSDVQTLDLIHSVGDAESFCRSNAIKYLSRYDKKGSAKNDILKAMHYCLLLYYFSGNTQEPDYTNTRYETF
jgi:hypothetical protein